MNKAEDYLERHCDKNGNVKKVDALHAVELAREDLRTRFKGLFEKAVCSDISLDFDACENPTLNIKISRH